MFRLFHLNEMLIWWLPGCKYLYVLVRRKAGICDGVPSTEV